LKFAELEGYIRAVEELLPANPDGAKYLRLTTAIGSKENKKANKLIQELGYVLVKGKILPVVVPFAKIDAGMIIPIIGREDETIRRTDEMLIRLDEEKLKAETIGELRVGGADGTDTERESIKPGQYHEWNIYRVDCQLDTTNELEHRRECRSLTGVLKGIVNSRIRH
jgi:hypothetical protein